MGQRNYKQDHGSEPGQAAQARQNANADRQASLPAPKPRSNNKHVTVFKGRINRKERSQ